METALLFLLKLCIGVLPPSAGKTAQPGIAGSFAGLHNGVLLVAGGANFEQGYPWDGGKKIYKNDIYICRKKDSGDLQWQTLASPVFPVEVAYGVSVETPEGIWCIGGQTASGISADIHLLSFSQET
ncbi:MAG: hypothetical protein LBE91_10710 [Tannerella sp.]|jgi:N-acetylneuraminic acid mutarotase|nr:hypothetical protein [Tannerella sp.]